MLIALKGIEPEGVDDYMPYLRQCRPPAEPMTDAEILAAIEGINKALAGA